MSWSENIWKDSPIVRLMYLTLFSLVGLELLSRFGAVLILHTSTQLCRISGNYGNDLANYTYGHYCLDAANYSIEYGTDKSNTKITTESDIPIPAALKIWLSVAVKKFTHRYRESRQKSNLAKALVAFDAVSNKSEQAGVAAYWAGLICLRGLNKDKNLAKKYFQSSAQHGIPAALFEMALLISKEQDIPQKILALELFEKVMLHLPQQGDMYRRALLEMAKIESVRINEREANLHKAQEYLHALQQSFSDSLLETSALEKITNMDATSEVAEDVKIIEESHILLVEVAEKIKTEAQRRLTEAEREKREAVENMLAMFAHKFRGAVDSIMFNTEHLHDERLYVDMAQTMNGLLDMFAIVSTSPERIADSFQADVNGSGTPIKVFTHSIKLALMQLCSHRDRRRMSQYYLAHAKRQGQAPDNLTLKTWISDEAWQAMESSLQEQWHSDVGRLIVDSEINSVAAWMNEHLLPLYLTGFTDSDIHFDPHGRKASMLTIVFTEIMVNAIKHGVPGSSQAITVSWREEGDSIVFASQNPSTKETRSRGRGSGRGHKFLSMLAEHMGGSLAVDVYQDVSQVRLRFPANLMKGTA